MRRETQTTRLVVDTLVVTYADIVDLLEQKGMEMDHQPIIELCSGSPGSCGQQHRSLLPGHWIAFSIKRMASGQP